MTNRPFYSEGCNISNEIFYTTTPACYGNQNVAIGQTHKRTVMDTDNSCVLPSSNTNMTAAFPIQSKSILKQPPPSYLPFQSTVQFPQQSNCRCNPSALAAQQYIVPGGVTFRFNQDNQYQQSNDKFDNTLVLNNGTPFRGNINVCQNALQQRNFAYPSTQQQQTIPCRTTNLQELMAMRNMQNRNLESLLLQEHIRRNPFELRFHLDGQTDTLDFYGGSTPILPSKGAPDFQNVSGVMTQTYGADLQNVDVYEKTNNKGPLMYCYKSNLRRLHLKPNPDLETKDMRIHFAPTPEEIQGNQKKDDTKNDEKNETTNVVTCENPLCGTNDQSKNNCKNFNTEDDQIMIDLIQESLQVISNENESTSKEVNTEPTNMEDKSSETKKVHYEDNEEKSKKRRRRRCKSKEESQSSESDNNSDSDTDNKFKCCL